MNDFDQGSHLATLLERSFVLARVNELAQLNATFRTWFTTKTASLGDDPDRIADLVALMDDATRPEEPWLFVHEFQSSHDPDKLGSMLIAAAIFRHRARDPDHAERRLRVLPVLIYLKGLCPERHIDMRTPNGCGIAHAPVVWELETDSALQTLQAVEAGTRGWGGLFWTPLMAGGGSKDVLALWLRLFDTVVPPEQRSTLAYIAIQFAELSGCRPAWVSLLEGRNVTESILGKQMRQQGEEIGNQRTARKMLLFVVETKFGSQIPEDYLRLIREQESLTLLDGWFRAAVTADTAEAFLAHLRQ